MSHIWLRPRILYEYMSKKSPKRPPLLARFIKRELYKHPLAIPVATFLLLIVVSALSFIVLGSRQTQASDSRVVILSADKKRQTLPTKAETVDEFLEKAGVSLNEGDVVEPARDAAIDDDNFRINVYRARPVLIIDGDQRKFAFSAATTPRSVAEQTGVKVYPEDKVNTRMQVDFLSDGAIGEKIVVDRATPTNLNLYGTQVVLRTHAKTVRDLLAEKKIKLGKEDSVQPALDTPLTSQTQVFVVRIGTQIQTVEEPIAMEIETIQDNSLSFGTMAIRQKGSPGKKLVTYQIELKNSREIGRKAIQTVVAQEPVKQIVARGQAVSIPSDKTSIMAAAGVAPSDYPYVNYIINHENALWCPTRWQGQRHCPAYYEEKFPGAETHTSTGYGLCQSTPAIKMSTMGADWRTNPVTQLRWCADYAKRRYGGWENAYNQWIVKKWW